MAQPFDIRPFQPADLPAMQEIRRLAFEPVFQSFRDIVGEEIGKRAFADADAEQSQLLETLCGTGSVHQVFVATVGDEVVGFVTYSLDEKKQIGEIGLNAMHPEHARQGIGAAMYEFVLERMKSAGMKVATVGTGGDPSHAPARRAYEKVGFGPAIPSVYLYRLLF
ncbi:GNAT family N-acetyltransferase [Archangium lansingense]|uniref:GNAT family N-acetyltransferase n=1 Tax=Archangium lansingense TaxID=2995310 RepID=A0ABT4AEW0_9BACT|nr:GNAT family N-acetyltransferase [Archangium lansinium]MCY1080217.1 GNAT family N-acetyltransferase [Archangium lansinium]